MKKLFMILALSLLFKVSAYSDDELEYEEESKITIGDYQHSVGVRYSNMSGYGLSIAKRFVDVYEVRLSGFLHYQEYTKWTDMSKTVTEIDSKNNLFDIGLEIRRNIFQTDRSRVFGLIGAGYSLKKDKDKRGVVSAINDRNEKFLTTGVGLGLEFFLHNRVSVDFNFGYKFDYIDIEDNSVPSLDISTNLGLGLGLSIVF